MIAVEGNAFIEDPAGKQFEKYGESRLASDGSIVRVELDSVESTGHKLLGIRLQDNITSAIRATTARGPPNTVLTYSQSKHNLQHSKMRTRGFIS